MKRQNGIQLGSESFLGWLVCLVICLLPSGLFGATAERTNPLQIGVGDTTLTFSTDGTNNPANDSTDPFTGEGGLVRNIAVSGADPAHGIYFSGTGFPGKTLTLANGNITYDNTLPYLISATIPESSNDAYAAAIDLTGVSGAAGSPSTLALDNTAVEAADGGGDSGPKDYRFFAQAKTTGASKKAYAVALGVSNASSNTTANYLTFDPRGARLEATAAATADTAAAYAALCGTGRADGSSNFSHWTIGAFGANSSLSTTATGTSTGSVAYAALFGAGRAQGGDFSHWQIGAFGAHSSLSASATGTSGNSGATLFGTGWAQGGDFSSWQIGNFGEGAILSATASGSYSTYAALFGTGYATSNSTFSSWQIGGFGAHASLSATATGTGTGAAHAALFGIGQAYGGNTFSYWAIGAFGANASLSATATGGSGAHAALFGTGQASVLSGSGSTFSNWTIGNFGANASLSAIATGTGTGAAYAALFGTGQAYGSITFSNWTIGDFGANASLSTTATSGSGASAALFGAGVANGGDFSHWTVEGFEGTASLSVTVTGYSGTYAALFGAGYASSSATLADWTAEFRGSGTLTAAGYRSDPDYIYLGALGGDKNENFRFYFNNGGDGAATVSIGALKLGEPVDTTTAAKQATMVLASDQGQGQADGTKYARAIALGPDFQLNVGRSRELMAIDSKPADHTLETDASVASGGQPSGGSGTLNIFGAIGKARNGATPTGSIIRVDSGWTVNAYGPVEDLASIAVNDGTFNAYDSIKNIALSHGNVNAYGTSDGIGTITLNGGNLTVARCEDTHFAENFAALKSGMRYVHSDGTKYGAGEENTLVINDANYPWKGTTAGGNLTLNAGDRLVFHVDSSREDPAVKSMAIAGADGVFELVKGYVTVEDGCSLTFNGGKICLIDDNPSSDAVLPAHTDAWLIRAKGSDGVKFESASYGDTALEAAPHTDLPLVTRHRMPASEIMAADTSGCAELHGELNVYLFHDARPSVDTEGHLLAADYPIAGVYIANDSDIPVVVAPLASATRQANTELAAISAATTSILRTAAINSLTDGDRPDHGPFAGYLGGHLRQDEIDGFAYRTNLTGVACGVDHRFQPASGGSLRLGAIAGYLGGNVHFSGIASGREKTVAQKTFSGAVFAAYEIFGKNDLKTNINVFAGLQHAKNELSRENNNGYLFFGNMNADGRFVTLEAVKILCCHRAVQVGPWALVSYNHVRQDGYDEHGNAPANAGAQTVSSATHNFLDTTVGLALEKDWQRTDVRRNNTGAFLKCGWQHRAIRDHSAVSVQFTSESLRNASYPATFGYAGRNSLAILAGLRANLNGHWDTAAAFHATLAKSDKSFALSLALGYNF